MTALPYDDTDPDVMAARARGLVRPLAPPKNPRDADYEEGVFDGIDETQAQMALKLAQKAMCALDGEGQEHGIRGNIALLKLQVDNLHTDMQEQRRDLMSAVDGTRNALSLQIKADRAEVLLAIAPLSAAMARIEERRMHPLIFALLVICAVAVAWRAWFGGG